MFVCMPHLARTEILCVRPVLVSAITCMHTLCELHGYMPIKSLNDKAFRLPAHAPP